MAILEEIELCTWCIGELAWNPGYLQIEGVQRPPSGLYGVLPLILTALREGRTVRHHHGEELSPAVTTWHSDPICGPHLILELDLHRQQNPNTRPRYGR